MDVYEKSCPVFDMTSSAFCTPTPPQPFHAYVMGIPGIKICTASSPEAAYGITKSMIRDNGPGILFCPVKMMKGVKGRPDLGRCLPLNKAAVLHAASDEAVSGDRVRLSIPPYPSTPPYSEPTAVLAGLDSTHFWVGRTKNHRVCIRKPFMKLHFSHEVHNFGGRS